MESNNITFEDIKKIFAPYREPMLKVGIATPDGVELLDLANYESVKKLNERITIAIHGYEKGRESSHAMPPGGPQRAIPQDKLKMWDDWVAGGMVEKADALA